MKMVQSSLGRFVAISALGLGLMLILAGPAFAISFSIDPNATLAPGGLSVTVTGTVVCGPGESGGVSAQVSRTEKAKLVANASGSSSINCDGTVQKW
jgi:hypothetical protein